MPGGAVKALPAKEPMPAYRQGIYISGNSEDRSKRGNFLFYIRWSDIDDFNIVGFLSLCTMRI